MPSNAEWFHWGVALKDGLFFRPAALSQADAQQAHFARKALQNTGKLPNWQYQNECKQALNLLNAGDFIVCG